MKLFRTVLFLTVVVCLLNITAGCQDAEKPSVDSPAALEQSETANAVAAQPKPVKETPKPAEKPATVYKAVKGGKTRIAFEKTSHNLGKMEPNKYYNLEFKFQNVGTADLEIIRTHATCGCTVPKLDKKIYAPGEKGVIKVRFHAQKTAGPIRKPLDVYTNDPNNKMVKCTILGYVELAIMVEPKSLSLSLKKENAGIKPIKIKSTNGKKFSISSIKDYNKVFTFDFDPKKKATEFTFTPKVNMQTLQKKNNGSIIFYANTPEINQVNVTYAALPLFTMSRARIVIQRAKPSVPQEKEVWITSNYGDIIKIESIKSSNSLMKLVKKETVGNRIKLTIKITPPVPGQTAKRHFSDKMAVKIAGVEPKTIFCTGLYDPSVLKPVNTETK